MKPAHVCSLALSILISSVCEAEILLVDSVNQGFQRSRSFTDTLFNGGVGQISSAFESRLTNYTTEIDSDAGTAKLTHATFAYGGISETSTLEFPGTFPNPAVQLTETFTFNPLTLATPLVSSSTSPLTSIGGTRFRANVDFVVSYPESFVLTGTYHIQGPTESATAPFSETYQRVGASANTGTIGLIVDTGNNFPATLSVTTESLFPLGRAYEKTGISKIFTGTIDGVTVEAYMGRIELWHLAVPEPAGFFLAAFAAAAFVDASRSRRKNLVSGEGPRG
jgi:hypothetical protein